MGKLTVAQERLRHDVPCADISTTDSFAPKVLTPVKHIEEFVDERHKSWCIHCGNWIARLKTNRDHVPSKCLLSKPYPTELPVIEVCQDCNNGFSHDEEYLVAFLGAVLCGSTDPDEQSIPRSAAIFQRNPKLRERIERSKTECTTPDGDKRLLWTPEQHRINRIIQKNARGHAFFEYGEPMLAPPDQIWVAPLETLDATQRADFENIAQNNRWPEVGSRMMTRVITGQDLDEGWVIVQAGVYRYAVMQEGTMLVRLVIQEYLAAEVCWTD